MKFLSSFFLCICFYLSVSASYYCSRCVYKVTCYSVTGQKYTGYIEHMCENAGETFSFISGNLLYNNYDLYENYPPQVTPHDIDWDALPYSVDTTGGLRILCVDTTYIHSEYTYLDPDKYSVPDVYDNRNFDTYTYGDSSFFKAIAPEYHILSLKDSTKYSYYEPMSEKKSEIFVPDTNTFKLAYAQVEYIDFDTISLVTVDSILWCAEMFQLVGVDSVGFSMFQKPVQHIWSLHNYHDDLWWIDVISFDSTWTTERFAQYIDVDKILQKLEETNTDYAVFQAFHPEIQEAIGSHKLFCVIRYSP